MTKTDLENARIFVNGQDVRVGQLLCELDARDATIAALREALDVIPLDVMAFTGPPYVCTFSDGAFKQIMQALHSLDLGAELLARHEAELERLKFENESWERMGRPAHKAAIDALWTTNPEILYESPAQVIEWLRQRAEAAERDLAEWQDYWGADSPHDTHVQVGTSEKFARQLGKEQARANTAENRLDQMTERAEAAESALEKIASMDLGHDPWKACAELRWVADRALGRSRTIPIPEDYSPMVKPKAPTPCEVTPKPENAL